MIRSMTGFASLTREADSLSVSVTARSVNHRYLDVQLSPAAPPSSGSSERFANRCVSG